MIETARVIEGRYKGALSYGKKNNNEKLGWKDVRRE